MVTITATECSIVHRVINRHFHHVGDHLRDELVSAGHYGLAQAATRYDSGMPGAASFNTYAWQRVRGAMLDALRETDHLSRKQRARVTQGRMQDPGAPFPLDLEWWATSTPDPHDAYQALEDTDLLTRAITTLPPREQLVIRCFDLHDWPMRDIGALLGVNESRVSQIRTAALERLHEQLADMGSEG